MTTNSDWQQIPDHTDERIKQLVSAGEVKAVLEGGSLVLAGYEADAKHVTLYPTNGDAPVRVPREDRDYYLAKPAPLKNPDGSRKQTSMGRVRGGVIFGYSDGTPFEPAFTVVPPQEPHVPVAGGESRVAPKLVAKVAPRRSRRRGSRGRRRSR